MASSRSRVGDPVPGSTAPASGMASALTRPITIVLADDHRVVRSGLRVLLESDDRFRVIDEAGDVPGTLESVRSYGPQVLILDLNMGGASSLDAIPQLRADAPETQIVVLTMQENPAFARAALRAGALGYVLKDAADTELTDAVVMAAVGTHVPEPGDRRQARRRASTARPGLTTSRLESSRC